jgi:outer membrane scaffolding protein for murein synthesis (MipA/OmpV family)
MLIGGKLVPQLTGASCMADGSLSIGNPVEMGPYTLPGNNYHVYDIPLFWANLRADFARRVAAWTR